MKILVVDDDNDLLEFVQFALKRAGYEVVLARDEASAARAVQEEKPDLAVLDVNLGAGNGFDLLEKIRRSHDFPVIMLTARDSEDDKVRGLALGADDYLSKPFSPREFVARTHALIRRAGIAESRAVRVLDVGPLHLDAGKHSVTYDARPIDLTVTEFRVLEILMLNAGKVVPTAELLRTVWGHYDPHGSDVVRAIVHRLRRKLEDDPQDPRLVHTVAGVGVMIDPVDRAEATPP